MSKTTRVACTIVAMLSVAACADEPTAPDPEPGSERCAPIAEGELVASGATLTQRPAGSVLRLLASYQGNRIGLAQACGATLTLGPSDGALAAGVNAGYWYELRDGAGQALYTRSFRDPSIAEVPPGPGGGSPTNAPIPYDDEKVLRLDVPNGPAGKAVVIFGSPYGTSEAATELARFLLP